MDCFISHTNCMSLVQTKMVEAISLVTCSKHCMWSSYHQTPARGSTYTIVYCHQNHEKGGLRALSHCKHTWVFFCGIIQKPSKSAHSPLRQTCKYYLVPYTSIYWQVLCWWLFPPPRVMWSIWMPLVMTTSALWLCTSPSAQMGSTFLSQLVSWWREWWYTGSDLFNEVPTRKSTFQDYLHCWL